MAILCIYWVLLVIRGPYLLSRAELLSGNWGSGASAGTVQSCMDWAWLGSIKFRVYKLHIRKAALKKKKKEQNKTCSTSSLALRSWATF